MRDRSGVASIVARRREEGHRVQGSGGEDTKSRPRGCISTRLAVRGVALIPVRCEGDRSELSCWLKTTPRKGLNKSLRTVYKMMSLCSNSGFHGTPPERCSCYVEAHLHVSKRRLFLCGVVPHQRTLRLFRENGASW